MAFVRVVDYINTPSGWAPFAGRFPPLETSPALWCAVAGRATRRPLGIPHLASIALEFGMLLSHLDHDPGVPLRWNSTARAAPPHLSRFLTESAALALTVQMAATYGWTWGDLLLNIDDLPADMKWLCPNRSRPDIVFVTPLGLRAAESKGRSVSPVPALKALSPEQAEAVTKKENWSTSLTPDVPWFIPPTGAPWSMAWSWIGDSYTTIDHFDPGEPIQLNENSLALLLAGETERVASMLERADADGASAIDLFGQYGRVAKRGIADPVRSDLPITEWLAIAAWPGRVAIPRSDAGLNIGQAERQLASQTGLPFELVD